MSLSKLQDIVRDRGGLACCNPRGCKESDTMKQLNNNNSSKVEVMLITITYSVRRLVVSCRLQWWLLAWRKCSENVGSPHLPGIYPNSDLGTLGTS